MLVFLQFLKQRKYSDLICSGSVSTVGTGLGSQIFLSRIRICISISWQAQLIR